MVRIIIAAIGLLGVAAVTPAGADQPLSTPTQQQNPSQSSDKRAEVPPNGVIHPAPGATHDKTVTPPNVDPGMVTKPPPGAPGNNPAVVPK